jgi:hypothetical protein
MTQYETCDSYHLQLQNIKCRLTVLEAGLSDLRARGNLAEVIARFNELVVQGMRPYCHKGQFLSPFTEFQHRRCTDADGKDYFDNVYVHVAANLLEIEPTTDLAAMLTSLGIHEVARNPFAHTTCTRAEAEIALNVVLKGRYEVQKRAFSLLIDKVCFDDEFEPKFHYRPDFKMPALRRSPEVEVFPTSASTSGKTHAWTTAS